MAKNAQNSWVGNTVQPQFQTYQTAGALNPTSGPPLGAAPPAPVAPPAGGVDLSGVPPIDPMAGFGVGTTAAPQSPRDRLTAAIVNSTTAPSTTTPALSTGGSASIPPNSTTRGPDYVYRRTPFYNMMQNGSAYSFDYGQPTYNDLRRTRNNNDSGPIPSAYINFIDK